MWLSNIKHPLQEHAYALYPLITIATVIILSCRITALTRTHPTHILPSPWTTIVSFGDSYSDSGNGARITGNTYPSEPYWHHRFTNGPNWIDNLIRNLGGLTHIKMRNFAHGGATTDNAITQGTLLGHNIPGMHQQVRGFIYKARSTGYPKPETTLYTMWTGANDILAIGTKAGHRRVQDVEESVFQNVLQLERESHSRVQHVLVLTPPPVEDSPLVKREHAKNREGVQTAAKELTRSLPYALLEKLKSLGKTTMKDSSQIAHVPHKMPHELPHHRHAAASPIAHFLSATLPHSYDHTIPREHNGTNHPNPLFLHTQKPADHLRRPLLKLAKRSPPHVHPKTDINVTHHLNIMVYDAYHFIKHAEANPQCFGLNPKMLDKPCGAQKHCYDRVWMDDANLTTAMHYWMAQDITARLHLWHMQNSGGGADKHTRNNTRVREIELEMVGYPCPMRPAPINF
ncbi:hypothetical protein IWW43_001700 [Coemansia sp. RSA 1935]|nr:hypothetical protein GGH20_001339 [Coemansia sp. RSA 1937]KAJ2535350.1 hypothetical protein IWW43_001700 [Coemansia sp. RSA 1935]